MFDFTHPFFEPLWRRIVIFLICMGWGAFEFATGAPFWGTVFMGAGAFAGWHFFINRQEGGGDK